MIDLLSTSQILLRDAGFKVRLTAIGHQPVICFEDGALFGFCVAFDQTDDLISQWNAVESQLLMRFAPEIRAAGEKAWNVYCVFVCVAPGSTAQKRVVSWIEEDLERTRKIAACDIASRADLVRVLLPLLPVQYQPALLQEDATARLLKRIEDIAPQAAHAVLNVDIPVSDVVRLLGERA